MRSRITVLTAVVLFAPTLAAAETLLHLESPPREFVGAGLTQTFTEEDGTFDLRVRSSTGNVRGTIQLSHGENWYVVIGGPAEGSVPADRGTVHASAQVDIVAIPGGMTNTRLLSPSREHLTGAHSPEEPLVLCGDFNICRAPIDSWDEEAHAGGIFHTDEERARLARLIDWGLLDVFREQHPDTQAFSWWDYRSGAFHRKHGLRIDLLLATQAVAGRVKSVEIDREYRKKQDGLTASDHAPVMMDLD